MHSLITVSLRESDGQERMKIIHTIPPYFHCSFKIFSQHQKGELFLGCGQTQFVNEAGELEAWDLVLLLLFKLYQNLYLMSILIENNLDFECTHLSIRLPLLPMPRHD